MSNPKRLTTARIESTPASHRHVWLSDNDGCRGLGRLLIRIGPSGSRRFYYRYSKNKRSRTIPLGIYSRTKLEGHLTLEEARSHARNYAVLMVDPKNHDLRVMLSGQLPERARTLAAPRHESGTTLLDLCWAYQIYVAKHRSLDYANACARDIKNYIACTDYAKRQADNFSSDDAVALLRDTAKRGRKDKVNRIRSLLHASFNFAIESELDPAVDAGHNLFSIKENPIKSVKKIKTSAERLQRVLSGKELGLFWNCLKASSKARTARHRLIRCSLLLGGQRCLQLLRAKTTDIDIDSQTLTLLDGKGRRSVPRVHLLPLTERVWEEFRPMIEECKALGWTYLFHANRDAPICDNGVSKAVLGISEALLSSNLIQKKFCYLDIRRTLETRMSDLKISKEIRAQLQSHDLGGIQMTHYNRSDFLDQKREALETWQRYLLECAEQVQSVLAPT